MCFVTGNILPAPGAKECIQKCSRLITFEIAVLLPWKKRTDHCLRDLARNIFGSYSANRHGVTPGKSLGTCLLCRISEGGGEVIQLFI